jgi:hypothetical protein
MKELLERIELGLKIFILTLTIPTTAMTLISNHELIHREFVLFIIDGYNRYFLLAMLLILVIYSFRLPIKIITKKVNESTQPEMHTGDRWNYLTVALRVATILSLISLVILLWQARPTKDDHQYHAYVLIQAKHRSTPSAFPQWLAITACAQSSTNVLLDGDRTSYTEDQMTTYTPDTQFIPLGKNSGLANHRRDQRFLSYFRLDRIAWDAINIDRNPAPGFDGASIVDEIVRYVLLPESAGQRAGAWLLKNDLDTPKELAAFAFSHSDELGVLLPSTTSQWRKLKTVNPEAYQALVYFCKYCVGIPRPALKLNIMNPAQENIIIYDIQYNIKAILVPRQVSQPSPVSALQVAHLELDELPMHIGACTRSLDEQFSLAPGETLSLSVQIKPEDSRLARTVWLMSVSVVGSDANGHKHTFESEDYYVEMLVQK